MVNLLKRAFDILFSFIGLLLLSPLLLIIAVLIRLDSPGPIFFTQIRIGKNFRPFRLYKFRTMVRDAQQKGLQITVGGDPRITRVGRFLRKTKLDELPQLLNVLKGDMSFVGPRPEVEKYVNLYKKDYEEILKVRPGMTDIATYMYINEEEVLKQQDDPEEFYIHILLPTKIKLAKEYVKRATFVNDLKLIMFTILRILYPHQAIERAINFLLPYRRFVILSLQTILFLSANYLAFLIRFDGQIPAGYLYLFWKYLPLLLILRLVSLILFSLDRGLWRYVTTKDLYNVAASVSISSIAFFIVVRHILGEVAYPRSIYVIDWLMSIFFLSSIRLLRRLNEEIGQRAPKQKRVLIIGAGRGGELFLRDIERSQNYPYEVVGFIDDDPNKRGLKIRGIPVFGTRKELDKIVERMDPDEFIIAIPSLPPSKLEEIVKDLRRYGLPVKRLPGFWNILQGRSGNVETVEPEDVLFRPPVCEGCEGLENFFKDKRVVVTGAGGSIGAELSRQILSYGVKCLVLFERHEESLYKIDLELRSRSDLTGQVVPIIGDILDERKVEETIRRYQPDIIFHAAAYKHVPLMEENPYEAFKTNVVGTRTLVSKVEECGVERFVLISTDKAVNPVNVMGMTKKLAEEVLRYYASQSNLTKYITVRFGNVLESSGSVIPLFKEQIKKGGPVTVTHPEIKRYFMTIPEAVGLVLQASAMGSGGEIFVLDMGEPVRILDLAKRLIELYGYRPGIDIEIVFTGLRPGEKMSEELFNKDERVERTLHPKIYRAVVKRKVKEDLLTYIEALNNPDFFKHTEKAKHYLLKSFESLFNTLPRG